jgi:hypothetical protein
MSADPRYAHGIDPCPPKRHAKGVEHLGSASEVLEGAVGLAAVHRKES